jgi:excisionase family DNA binding protein
MAARGLVATADLGSGCGRYVGRTLGALTRRCVLSPTLSSGRPPIWRNADSIRSELLASRVQPDKEWCERAKHHLHLRDSSPNEDEGSPPGSDTVGSDPMATDVPEITEAARGALSDTGRLSRPGPGGSVTFQAQRTLGTSRLLTVREVADRLRISRATVYRLVAAGRIPAVRVSSGAIRVHQTVVARLGK